MVAFNSAASQTGNCIRMHFRAIHYHCNMSFSILQTAQSSTEWAMCIICGEVFSVNAFEVNLN